MREKIIKLSIIIFAWTAVIYPVWVRLSRLELAWDRSLLQALFPALGLAAFAILWLHVISGVFEPWLRKRFDFDNYVRWTSTLVLFLIILHPLLLLIDLGFDRNKIYQYYGVKYIIIGAIGWFLLITYDVSKFLKEYEFFSRNWRKILFISTIGILVIFFHSLGIGSDLQRGPLRYIWIFYGSTAILGTIYNFGIRKIRN